VCFDRGMTPPFTLRLERQGGFAGIPMHAVVSSSELEQQDAARLCVETPEGREEYRFGQDAVGPQLQPLVERLEQQLAF
jgi:hypothetical protein